MSSLRGTPRRSTGFFRSESESFYAFRSYFIRRRMTLMRMSLLHISESAELRSFFTSFEAMYQNKTRGFKLFGKHLAYNVILIINFLHFTQHFSNRKNTNYFIANQTFIKISLCWLILFRQRVSSNISLPTISPRTLQW